MAAGRARLCRKLQRARATLSRSSGGLRQPVQLRTRDTASDGGVVHATSVGRVACFVVSTCVAAAVCCRASSRHMHALAGCGELPLLACRQALPVVKEVYAVQVDIATAKDHSDALQATVLVSEGTCHHCSQPCRSTGLHDHLQALIHQEHGLYDVSLRHNDYVVHEISHDRPRMVTEPS
jgi:hypothetical protein